MAVTPKGSQVIFTTDQLQLSSRLIEGKFPDYTQILPKEHATRAVVGTAALASLVKEVWPFAEGNKHVVVLSLKGGAGESLDPGQLVLEATAQDLGDTTRYVSATVDGPDQRIIYDIRHLMDALEVIKTPEITIELTSEAKPGVIRPIGGVDFVTVITALHPECREARGSSRGGSRLLDRLGRGLGAANGCMPSLAVPGCLAHPEKIPGCLAPLTRDGAGQPPSI